MTCCFLRHLPLLLFLASVFTKAVISASVFRTDFHGFDYYTLTFASLFINLGFCLSRSRQNVYDLEGFILFPFLFFFVCPPHAPRTTHRSFPFVELPMYFFFAPTLFFFFFQEE